MLLALAALLNYHVWLLSLCIAIKSERRRQRTNERPVKWIGEMSANTKLLFGLGLFGCRLCRPLANNAGVCVHSMSWMGLCVFSLVSNQFQLKTQTLMKNSKHANECMWGIQAFCFLLFRFPLRIALAFRLSSFSHIYHNNTRDLILQKQRVTARKDNKESKKNIISK